MQGQSPNWGQAVREEQVAGENSPSLPSPFTLIGQENLRCRLDHLLGCTFLGENGVFACLDHLSPIP